VSLTSTVVSDNRVDGLNNNGGGGIFVRNGPLALNDSQVVRNSIHGIACSGGGIGAVGDVTLNRSTVAGNTTSGDNADGGGIFVRDGTLTLNQSIITDNHTLAFNGRGGGFRVIGNVTLNRSVVSNNSTAGRDADGGGLRVSGTLLLNESIVSGNRATGDVAWGGGIYGGTQLIAVLSTISGNYTTGERSWGGGIFSRGTVTLIQSTVSGNSTSGPNAHGGGLYSANALTATQSTIVDNHSTGDGAAGGGIWSFAQPINFSGSILAGNEAAGGNPDLRPGLGTLSINYSIIGDTSDIALDFLAQINSGSGNQLNVSPRLGPLTYNGGPVLPDGTPMLTHALLPGSPALDAGDPAAVAGMNGVPLYDQRGMPFSRVANGDDIPEARIDIGAFEWQPNPLIGDYSYSGAVDAADYIVWRKTLGSTNDLRADGDGDADVDQEDYVVWRANFGAVATKPLATSAVASQHPDDHDEFVDDPIPRIPFDKSATTIRLRSDSPPVTRQRAYETATASDEALLAWLAGMNRGVGTPQPSITVELPDEEFFFLSGNSLLLDVVFAAAEFDGL
jgi:hypothetical protein